VRLVLGVVLVVLGLPEQPILKDDLGPLHVVLEVDERANEVFREQFLALPVNARVELPFPREQQDVEAHPHLMTRVAAGLQALRHSFDILERAGQ
jgi:hypothetical protein